jgi:hypothetical protein
MEKKELNKKVEEINVLDKGKNMDDLEILIQYCCYAWFIPYRMG